MDIEAGLELLKRDKKLRVLINKFGRADFNITKEEEQCRLKSLIKTISARTKKIHATLRNFTTNMNSQLDEQWSQFESMIQLLNIEH